MAKRLAATVAELEDEKRHAEELLDAKRELVANVSHELRTPLASIRAHVESLLMQDREPVDPRRSEYLEVIHRETEHLSRLVDDLFALSTAEAGALPLRLQPLALADVIEDVAGAIRDVTSSRTYSSVSTVATRLATGPAAAPAWAWPSSASWSRRWGALSRLRARSPRAAAFPSRCLRLTPLATVGRVGERRRLPPRDLGSGAATFDALDASAAAVIVTLVRIA